MDANLSNGNDSDTNSINVQTETSWKITTLANRDSIDKAFDDIASNEGTFVERGYSDGHISGLIKQSQEGYMLGIQKGFEIGSEVGQYRGFSLTWLEYLKSKSAKSPLSTKEQKSVKVLEKLLKTTEEISSSNPHAPSTEEENLVDVWDLLRDMRAKFTLIKSLLNIEESNNVSAKEQLISGPKTNIKPKTLNW